jgi:hypothetical protein
MADRRLIDLMDVKEMQAMAYLEYYVEKMPRVILQKELDDYCDRMAEAFVENHHAEFENEETLSYVKKHIIAFGADKAHSGKRFYEALYKQLKTFGADAKEKE